MKLHSMRLVISPLPWMLSQDMMAQPPLRLSRLALSALAR